MNTVHAENVTVSGNHPFRWTDSVINNSCVILYRFKPEVPFSRQIKPYKVCAHSMNAVLKEKNHNSWTQCAASIWHAWPPGLGIPAGTSRKISDSAWPIEPTLYAGEYPATDRYLLGGMAYTRTYRDVQVQTPRLLCRIFPWPIKLVIVTRLNWLERWVHSW
jgi:hypothetical protein